MSTNKTCICGEIRKLLILFHLKKKKPSLEYEVSYNVFLSDIPFLT